jgi:hypothetical protein
MFFRERTTDWLAPKIPAAVAAVLLITIFGVLYFGIFSNDVIEKFSKTTAAPPVQAAQVK